MCFSASASFVAAASLSAVGAATLRRTTRRTDVPFAMIPLLFGLQQLAEGVLWLSFRFDAPVLTRMMTYTYSLFSHTLWPVFVPLAVFFLEPVRWRRRALAAFEVTGIAVGVYLLYFILRYPVTAEVIERHIVYVSPHFYIFMVMVVYFTATCASTLVSSHPLVRLFGLFTFVSALAAYHFAARAFVSVWCFFAAILSLMVLLHFTRGTGMTHASSSPPRGAASDGRIARESA